MRPLLDLPEGILLVDKPKRYTSFDLVRVLRKRFQVKKIGHAGTLDPFATGLMVMLIGRQYTRLSDQFLHHDKEYETTVYLGKTTDTYDCEGTIVRESSHIPSLVDIHEALTHFQGEIDQIPPMYSAKKRDGKKLYELARKGIEIPRDPIKVNVQTTFISYCYPLLTLSIRCSKGHTFEALALI